MTGRSQPAVSTRIRPALRRRRATMLAHRMPRRTADCAVSH